MKLPLKKIVVLASFLLFTACGNTDEAKIGGPAAAVAPPAVTGPTSDDALSLKAVTDLNAGECDAIQNADVQKNCVASVARAQNQAAAQKASDQRDPALCDAVADATMKQDCVKHVADLKNVDQVTVTTNEATGKDDLSLCKQLTDPDQAKGCVHGATIKLAIEKKDIKLCDTLEGDYKGYCQQAYDIQVNGNTPAPTPAQ